MHAHARCSLLVLSLASVACTHEVEAGDPNLVLDLTGDDAFEDEGALVASPECSKDAILARAPNDERLWTLAVAHRWIDLGVTYDRGRTFEGYRRDCSGFVSMAWGLGKPGTATAGMEPFSDHPQMFEIPIDSLLPGDAINRRTRRQLPDGNTIGHVRLFGGWINKAEGTHCILEYYSTGYVGRAAKGTRADLTDYIGLRRAGMPTTANDASPPPAPPPAAPPPAAAPSDENPHANEPGCGLLGQGEMLRPNEGKRSCDGRFLFVHQSDGNVVLYGPNGPLWHAGTHGQATNALVMQTDGNLVLYRTDGSPAWHTGTFGHTPTALVVLDDGNVVLFGPNWSVLWETATARR